MNRFIKRLLLIILITLIADRALSYVASFFYSRASTTDEYKMNAVTLNMTAPVVFMGSSRCHHHYIPAVLSDSLHTEVYNAGLWGMRNIYFQYGLLCNILERYTPQTICLEIHPIDYLQTPFSTIETVAKLSPYVNYSKGCDEVLKKAGLYYKYQLSHLYRYNSEFASILTGNLTERSFAADKGYKRLIGQLDTTYGEIKPEKFPYTVDTAKVHYLQAFIDQCKARKITLIFLFSPMYAVEKSTMINIPFQIARKNNIPFLNHYYLQGISGHAAYYFDPGHLNEAGAVKYSSIISHELKGYIRKK